LTSRVYDDPTSLTGPPQPDEPHGPASAVLYESAPDESHGPASAVPSRVRTKPRPLRTRIYELIPIWLSLFEPDLIWLSLGYHLVITWLSYRAGPYGSVIINRAGPYGSAKPCPLRTRNKPRSPRAPSRALRARPSRAQRMHPSRAQRTHQAVLNARIKPRPTRTKPCSTHASIRARRAPSLQFSLPRILTNLAAALFN
jgi:hypothetical protein